MNPKICPIDYSSDDDDELEIRISHLTSQIIHDDKWYCYLSTLMKNFLGLKY
jgi:hypothetical protein